MWSSPLFWIVFAIAVFWALGAYNRLMRLRSAVIQAFGSFDAHMVRQVSLLGEFGAAHAVQPTSSNDPQQEMAALQGATTQLSASLAVARARPLQVDAMAALAAARDVLHASWLKAASTMAQGGSGDVPEPVADGSLPPHQAPSSWQVRWDEHVRQNDQAVRVFNDAVLYYNAAIAQFPANLLAWVFGFKAARGL